MCMLWYYAMLRTITWYLRVPYDQSTGCVAATCSPRVHALPGCRACAAGVWQRPTPRAYRPVRPRPACHRPTRPSCDPRAWCSAAMCRPWGARTAWEATKRRWLGCTTRLLPGLGPRRRDSLEGWEAATGNIAYVQGAANRPRAHAIHQHHSSSRSLPPSRRPSGRVASSCLPASHSSPPC